jgi:PAS domain S-box-containing protein
VSILFGLLGFALNFLDLQLVQFPKLKISILAGLYFPLLISMAWGWRYGLLSALAGGCQSMWWLWQSDGWGIIYAVPVFSLWIVWHGWWAEKREEKETWLNSAFIVELPFRLVVETGFYTIFRWLVSLNPPPWNPEITWNRLSFSWVHTVAFKHLITAYILLLAVHVTLALKPVRSFLGLKKRLAQDQISSIYALALLMGLFLWAVDSVVSFWAFNAQGRNFLEVAVLEVGAHEMFMRILYIVLSLSGAALIAGQIKQRAVLGDQLQDLNRKYASILTSTSYAVLAVDMQGLITVFNPGAEKLFGYNAEDIIGKPVLNFCPPDLQQEQAEVLRLTREKGVYSGYETERLRADGKRIPVEISLSLRTDSQGNPQGINAILSDITERKQAGEKLNKLNSELRAKNQELEQVLYATSHDLRSPLVNVQGFNRELQVSLEELASLLRTEHVPEEIRVKCKAILEDDIYESLEYILSSTAKMDALLSGLLVLSRLGRQELCIRDLDMHALIQEVLANFRHRIKEQQVEVELRELPACKADELQINQVFSNLVDNALKHLDPKRPGKIIISGKEEKNRVYYFIEDNGQGIPERHQDRIFELFHKLDPQTEGIGLGLNIVKHILDKHGGQIAVQSREGQGTKFILSIPK